MVITTITSEFHTEFIGGGRKNDARRAMTPKGPVAI